MRQIVYIASPESQQIHVWSLNHGGTLMLIQVVGMPGQVRPVVVNPNRRYLYVGVRPKFRILAYRITPGDGALTSAAESVLPSGPTRISTDHQGQFVFIGSYNAGNVSVTHLEDDLPAGVVDVVEGLNGCHSANISPDSRTLRVPALKQGHIYLFMVSDGGHLVAQDSVKMTTVEGAGPYHVMFHPSEQYAYCASKLNSSVDVWELKSPYGNIECIQTLGMMSEDFSDTRWAADIHITPNGRHLYVCNRTTNLIAALSVSEDGNVLSKEGSQLVETQSCGFNVDHNGKYLIAAR